MKNPNLTVIQVLPALESGGVERGTIEISKALASRGHRSIVISRGGRLEADLISHGARHISASIGDKSIFTSRFIPWMRRVIRELRPDIIHARSRLPCWITYLAWKSLPESERPRFVTTFHGYYSVNRYSEVMTFGEKVICVSHGIKKHIQSSYPRTDKKNLIVIPRGIDENIYHPNFRPPGDWVDQWYKEFPITKAKLIILLPARLSRWKGGTDFIHVIKKLIADFPIHGVLVGETPKKHLRYRQELEKLVDSCGLTEHVSFIGDRSDLREIMAISKLVFSLSNDPEAFGRTVLEALSLGVPVIGYDHGGVGEQLDHLFPYGKAALHNIDEVTRLARSLLSQELPPPVIQPNTQFLLSEMCEKTISLYREMVDGKLPFADG